MVIRMVPCSKTVLGLFILVCLTWKCPAPEVDKNQSAQLLVNGSEASGLQIPETLFGIAFEEINHAGAGGLWAELVSNRGLEAGGPNTPSNIDPWSIIGNESTLAVATDGSSCFERNEIALRMNVLCDHDGVSKCPAGGVGIYNPGFWGMNIEEGKTYKVVLHVRSSGSINISVSLTGTNGSPILATANIVATACDVANWTKMEILLHAKGTDHKSRLQLTTREKGIIWFDQVSVMPLDTYMGHGFQKELAQMLAELKPRFMRFPGGSFVEGGWLRYAYRWKATVGPWEERPGHFNDVWKYWTDDGLGYFEFLQLAEDIGALPVWVFNIGISLNDQVDSSAMGAFVREALDSIEFAKGESDSVWGSIRAEMGHPEPFDLRYIAMGNQDCGKKNYRGLGNYLKFYNAIKSAYPDMKITTNCDGSSHQLDHPADLYDYHVYTSAKNMFSMVHTFDQTSRSGPKAFVSEYEVSGKDAGTGSLLAALAEAAFLIGLEKNSDAVEMASYAPLFVNVNDRRYSPDAIVFNSSEQYGTPSYWMQRFFTESSGATYLDTKLQENSYSSLVASAISWQNPDDDENYIKVKVVNFGNATMNLRISISGLEHNSIQPSGSSKTVLTSKNLMDENSFREPRKVSPVQSQLKNAGKTMDVVVSPYSLTSFDLLVETSNHRITRTGSSSRYSPQY